MIGLNKRSKRKALHLLVVCAQIWMIVGSVTLATVQPKLPAPLAALQPLIGATKVAQAAGTVTGTVFQDFDADGIDDGANELGVGGVTVTAYDADGSQCGQTTSSTAVATLGQYTLGHTCTAATVRVEFTGLPSGYQSGPRGTNSGTGVQFVSATASNVDFGILLPMNYCQANPDLCTNLYINGDTNATAPTTTLTRSPYNSSGASPISMSLATKAQIGSTWGLAYARTTQALYAAAFLKRHVGVGPDGLGAIYQAPNANAAAPGTPTLLVDLVAQGIDVGQASVPANATRGLGAPTTPNHDSAVYGLIGKVGLGDLDLSEDGTTLWTVNLFQKTLLRIPIATPTAVNINAHAIPNPCSGGNARPFGLKVYQGYVYVGVVCDAQTSNAAADLSAVVYRFDPASTSFTNILNFPLNYSKGYVFVNGTCPAVSDWHPWSDTFPTTCGTSAVDGSGFVVWPQPLLSDIEFDVDGALILGFTDRLGHQTGFANYNTNAASTATYKGIPGGDILRASKSGSTFVLESNGTVGGLTGGAGNNQGPGGGEFYQGDNYQSPPDEDHREVIMGGVAVLPGSGEVAAIAFDPIDSGPVSTGGVTFLSNTDGSKRPGFILYGPSNNVATFSKANGLGDLELLCDAAPLEIGNRVWRDSDSDGIQDPNEPPIAGVIVTLQVATRTITATTNAVGEYYFSSIISPTVPGASRVNGISQLTPNTPFTLTINPVQTPLSGLTPTTANADGQTNNDPITDGRDSDGQTVGALYRIVSVTGGIGSNNHTYDWGFSVPVYDLALVKVAQVASVVVGGNVTYTLRVKNQGAAASGLYTVTDRLPSGFTFVAATSGGSHSSGVVTWANLPTLTPGATQDVFLVATVPATTGSYTNWAEISGDSGADEDSTPDTNTGQDSTPPNDPVSDRTSLADVDIDPSSGDEDDNDPATITVTPPPPPSYTLRKQLLTPDPVRVGDDITFTIRITNTGSTLITVLPLRDLYDTSSLLYLSASVLPDDSASDGQLDWSDLTASFGQDLAPNQSFAITTIFVARRDTTLLPGAATNNIARVLITPTTTVTTPVRIEAPTVVELASHSATYIDGQVTLAWATSSEVEAIGFNVLRQVVDGAMITATNAEWVKLNEQVIAAQQPGQATGASYRYTDANVTLGQNYRYVLEILDTGGQPAYRELGTVTTGGSAIYLPQVSKGR